MKKVIFVDRDGTIIREPADEQVDSLEKLEFTPGAISALKALCCLGYELVMVTNQDGLGTASFPMEDFTPAQEKMLATLRGEGVEFDDILIDRTFPTDNAPTRKPGIGMLGKYTDGSYDMKESFVIGDRDGSDGELAANLGCNFLKINAESASKDWQDAVARIRIADRRATICRKTRETDINIVLDLDGRTGSAIDSGLKFFDHMLEQIPHHSGVSLSLSCKGDLQVDEHHTMEDCGIALGEALKKALGDKCGIDRYGFALPMDESEALVLLDFGGRAHLEWDVPFTREYVGDTPTEMFHHFFESLCSAAACNMIVKAKGGNNHHIIEAVFKAFARSIKQAVRKDPFSSALPSSKGLL